MSQKIGTIKEIWQYPVKSMQGNKISEALLSKEGLQGDRLWTIWDEIDQQLVGGKSFRKIMRLKATYQQFPLEVTNPLVNITFPDGRSITSGKTYLNDLLASFVGHPISLKLKRDDKAFYLKNQEVGSLTALRQQLGMPPEDNMKNLATFPLSISLLLLKYAAPPGQLYDVYPIHFLTTNTLTWLQKAHPTAQIDVRRFRPTFLIDTPINLGDYPESKWQEGYLEIGETVIKIGAPTIRCSMPAQAQADLREDLEVAKALQTTAGQFVGSYGTVVQAGSFKEGDAVIHRPAKKIWQWSANIGRKMREPSTILLAKLDQKQHNLKKAKTKKLSTKATLIKNNFISFKVVKKVQESERITSFYLQGAAFYSFLPGQHLVIGLIIPDQSNPVIRAYSISNYDTDSKTYRISVKREGKEAIASNYLHTAIKKGSEIFIKRPQGQFFLHPELDRPVALISIGVGITPFISMLDYAVQTNRAEKITLLHGCRNETHHPFKEALTAYQKHATITTHISYSQSTESASNYQNQGHIDIATIQKNIPSKNTVFYLCGTNKFMRQIYQDLVEWGVNPIDIHYEQFNKAAPLEVSLDNAETSFDIHFQQSNLTTTWTPSTDSLMALAENCGLQPNFGCRYGICDACKVSLLSGTVTYDHEVITPMEKQEVLLCCAIPTDDLIIDL